MGAAGQAAGSRGKRRTCAWCSNRLLALLPLPCPSTPGAAHLCSTRARRSRITTSWMDTPRCRRTSRGPARRRDQQRGQDGAVGNAGAAAAVRGLGGKRARLAPPPATGSQPTAAPTAEARDGALVQADPALVQLDAHEVARLHPEQHVDAHYADGDLRGWGRGGVGGRGAAARRRRRVNLVECLSRHERGVLGADGGGINGRPGKSREASA